MRTKSFQCILSFLALVGTAHGTITPTAECTAQAWARAPDLAPNTIVHGDARVKISVECPAVEDVSFGLRFKERSFAKVLRSREDVKRLNPEPPRYDFSNPESFWALRPPRFANKSVEEAYEEIITNKALWIVREEERIVFETMQPINIGSRSHGALRDTVHDFSIFVPSTNFPPALDDMRSGFLSDMTHEIVYAEWIYEYFAQISFSNGTAKEIWAGFTAFQPQYDPAHASQGLTSAATELKPLLFGDMGENTVNYSIEISADSGLTFVAGTKSHIVTAVVTRTGFARTFSAPLNVFPCVRADLSPTWIAEYNLSDFKPGSVRTPTSSVLRATSDGTNTLFYMGSPDCAHQRQLGVSVIMPDSTSDEIQANKIVTTRSAPLTISIDVDDAHIPTFETYYQTLGNALTITLTTFRGEDEDVDPDDPAGERDFSWGSWSQFEDDEEEWVPWVKQEKGKGMPVPMTWRSYSGRVAVVVHLSKEGTSSNRCRRTSTDMLGQAVLSDETGCRQRPLIHYLDVGARGPIFVERDTIHDHLSVDAAEGELRAPILEPVVSSPPEGEEHSYRYYPRFNTPKPLIYVGATWAKKVANKN